MDAQAQPQPELEGFSLPAVLTIAGSDSSGGAGIQADLKTIGALGLYGESAITAVTAQNTVGVRLVSPVPPVAIAAQVDAVFEDIPPAAVKVGMVGSAEAAAAIAEALGRHGARGVVIDPVMVATSGATLAGEAARRALVSELFPLAELVTPNIPEAEVLSGRAILGSPDSRRAMESAAESIAGLTRGAVLVKGGHAASGADDLLRLPDGRSLWIEGARVPATNSHGTGCTLSSAVACGLASGLGVEEAVRGAKAYLTGALAAGLDLGRGSGPVDHFWQYRARGSRGLTS